MAGIAPFAWGAAKDALYDWLFDQLGIPVIWQGQDAPRPPYPYAALGIVALPAKTGEDEDRWEDEPDPGTGVKVVTVGDRVMTFSCQAYVSFEGVPYDHDTDASHLMSIASASLSRENVRSALRDAGLAIRDVMPIRDLTGAVDAAWLSRAVFDFVCGLAFCVDPGTFDPSINTVRVSSTLEGQTGTGDLDLVDEDMGG